MSAADEPEMQSELCPHGRPWDDCYEDGGHMTVVSGDGSGLPGPMGHPNFAFCKCGSAWFHAQVAMEQDRRITAHTALRCVECGDEKPIDFTGDHELQWTTDEWRAARDD